MAEAKQKSETTGAAKQAAQIALLDAIRQAVDEIVGGDTYMVSGQSAVLRNLAYAYRLTVGGPQPGSIEIGE